jgi:transglutaminase-like putative cysteine protease
MLIRVFHRTTYRYEAPATGVIQVLRLTPRNHDGQYVVHWRIDVSADCRLDPHEDAFGNMTHADGPFDALTVSVEGEVETRDTDGIIAGTVERFPPSLFLRETPLTAPDDAIAAFAAASRKAADADGLELLHLLLERLHREMTFDADPTHTARPSRSSAASARTSRISSFLQRAASAFRRAMSAAISIETMARPSRMPVTPGRRRTYPISAG